MNEVVVRIGAVFAAYRNGELTLEQVQAFATSEHHTAQGRVFESLTDRMSGANG